MLPSLGRRREYRVPSQLCGRHLGGPSLRVSLNPRARTSLAASALPANARPLHVLAPCAQAMDRPLALAPVQALLDFKTRPTPQRVKPKRERDGRRMHCATYASATLRAALALFHKEGVSSSYGPPKQASSLRIRHCVRSPRLWRRAKLPPRRAEAAARVRRARPALQQAG